MRKELEEPCRGFVEHTDTVGTRERSRVEQDTGRAVVEPVKQSLV